jgi:hypothetical protein
LSEFAFEIPHEDTLGVTVCAGHDVKDEDFVGFDEGADVQQIHEDGVFADEDGRAGGWRTDL